MFQINFWNKLFSMHLPEIQWMDNEIKLSITIRQNSLNYKWTTALKVCELKWTLSLN
jgi:hypothetical protein